MVVHTEDHAFLLHAVPHRETSLVVDLFTREHGRIAAVAKGAKRRGSALRPVLMQFHPLQVRFTGRNELRVLTGAHWLGSQLAPDGDALILGFYMNELLVRLLAREDPHEQLFDAYQTALLALNDLPPGDGQPLAGGPGEDILRRFEWMLLRETGYAPDLQHDAQGRAIEAEAGYRWRAAGGFVRAEDEGEAVVAGATLLDLAAGRFDSPRSRLQAKYLSRAILSHHLEGASLFTRQILIDLQRL